MSVKYWALGLLLSITAAQAQSCDDALSIGLGTFNTGGLNPHNMIVQVAPLPEARLFDVQFQVVGPDGEVLYVGNLGESIEAWGTFVGGRSGVYTVAATFLGGSTSCKIAIKSSELLPTIDAIEVSDRHTKLYFSWDQAYGAKEYTLELFDVGSSILTGYATDSREVVIGQYSYEECVTLGMFVNVIALSEETMPVDVVTGEPAYEPGIHILNVSSTTTHPSLAPKF